MSDPASGWRAIAPFGFDDLREWTRLAWPLLYVGTVVVGGAFGVGLRTLAGPALFARPQGCVGQSLWWVRQHYFETPTKTFPEWDRAFYLGTGGGLFPTADFLVIQVDERGFVTEADIESRRLRPGK